MKFVAISSLFAASVLFANTEAFALSAADVGHSFKLHEQSVVHQTGHRNRRLRNCRFSHGKLVCGGGHHQSRGGDHGRNRGHGNGHGGNRH